MIVRYAEDWLRIQSIVLYDCLFCSAVYCIAALLTLAAAASTLRVYLPRVPVSFSIDVLTVTPKWSPSSFSLP